MSRRLCIAVFEIIQIVALVCAAGHYSVIGPGTIRSKFKYNVAVSVHKAEGPTKIDVSIMGPSYNETKTVELQPMSTENVEFDVPQLQDGAYSLVAKGVSGLIFENSTKLNYADYKPATFIQTDKATYKPGDLVQFRVLFLDANTRPAKIEQPISILINDGARNRIKQLQNVKLTKGVYTGEFQLSEQPVLGDWNIEVVIEGQSPVSKSFEVAKYVLPKFEVSIETAKDVAIPDGVIKVTVRSKYTYGKSVEGTATVSIKPLYHHYGMNIQPEATKMVYVDGKGHVEFDLSKDLNIGGERTYVPPLKVLATMKEKLTGNTQNATATINLHSERYRIEGVNVPTNYQPGKPTKITVVVKNVDGSPVSDTKNKAKLIVHPPRDYMFRDYLSKDEATTPKEADKIMEFESNLDEHGMATFEFTLAETDRYYTVKCEFLDTTTYLSSISKFIPTIDTPELLKLTVNTKKPRLSKPVVVEVISSEKIPYFVYTIVARGNILKSEYVDVPEGRQSQTIKFIPTFEMIPKASLYVHYVYDNNLRFEEKAIQFEKQFENTIDISAQPQAKPGEQVQLHITTDPDSFVGLLGVDQSVLLLKSGNDITQEQIFNTLGDYDASTPWMRGYGRYPGQESGVVTMTNANYPYNDELYPSPLALADSVLNDEYFEVALNDEPMHRDITDRTIDPSAYGVLPIRKMFLESWIWTLLNSTDGGNFTLSKKIPDTITSWVVTGFSMNPNTGIALTANPTKIQVFQPFFVSTNLPYSVKRGEVIAIPVIIFNYMDKALDAEVVMENTDNEYDFTEATNEIEDKPLDVVQRVKRVSVASNTGRSISFMIRPKKIGQITLKITATTPLAGDAIHQMLKVEPEGVTQYENRAVFINLKDKNVHNEKLNVDIPAEAIPDSEYIEFSVVGDLLGPTLKNLDKLVRMPYGCGEQNMVNFVPNILVLHYLDAISKSMPAVTEKAKKFLEIGYQRELTYKHDDGSYSAFGKSDKAGSTWLTAYVMRSFHQAAKYTDIDPKVIVEGLDFLASKQTPNGSFPEYGKLFDSAHQNELGLTAFVLLAFLENVEHVEKYKTQVDNGMKYLMENVDKTDDQYSLAIASLALQIAKNPAADKVLTKLQGLAKQESDRKWWSKVDTPTEGSSAIWRWQPNSNDVEITSYILLAILDKEGAENALPIVKWLISQRNSNGGFASTQDTVVGLQALISFAEKTGAGSGVMDIEFTSSGGEENKGAIAVSAENSLVLQTHVLPKTTRSVDFTAKGNGSSMVQLSYRYNLAEKDKAPSFQVTTNVKEDQNLLIMDVCAEYVPADAADQEKESNMAVMEIALPSGYTAETDAFNAIEAVDRVKRTETKNADSMVIVYFDGLKPADSKCVPVRAVKTHAVAKQKPAAVSIYDYYQTNRRATEYYQVNSSLCDICEGEDCGSSCQKSKESNN
ncbi:C3 and PZP-like alpha-2-macroglobulin domain-containing protein 8 isoform X5 [Bactrocera tryoni]|uniref:C3 and PZP-like alpha-2-macroglobulin domain-containing protein 8 isoform X5 n=1 Tax=Bactrocera tryoni TaxID=59916 RepID=UPI001A96A410|nr:C3 and PZP-like alpha-2-macroglobulin domain-containing protein 8 isoform X5 [Bactrocera tryoni]